MITPSALIAPLRTLKIRSDQIFQFDLIRHLCMTLCMSFKTISLSEDAYKILKRAKRAPGESFTEVVRRASWDEPAETMGEALELLEAEFGNGKTTVTDEELETSRRLHAQRKAKA
jgi:predicted CopG family antitoxin